MKCRICQEEAFIKSRLKSKVILDCGHMADAEEDWDPTMPRPTVEDSDVPVRRLPAKKHGPPKARTESAPAAPVEPAKPAASFDSSAVAKKISDLLRRK